MSATPSRIILMTMINLNLYDDVVERIDKQKTWLNVKNKLLLSREIKYRRYYFIGKRYYNNDNFYFIITFDTPPENRQYHKLTMDDYGRVKIKLSSIWESTSLLDVTTDCNISLTKVEEDDDSSAYYIDI